MIYNGRAVNVLALWGEYVDLPANIEEPLPTYLPKVVCPNPAHDTYKQHFQINAKKPWVHCFAGCGISGSYEHALSVIHGYYDEEEDTEDGRKRAHKKARRLILKQSRVALGSDVVDISARVGVRKTHDLDSAVAKDQRALEGGAYTFLPKHVIAYLDGRGIDQPSRGKWQIGYDEDEERLVIPAFDARGAFRFLIKRKLKPGSHLKYLYTPGTLKTSLLFGACHFDREALRSLGLILCEGSLDAIRLHQLGFKTAGAILGTGISKRQVRIIDSLSPRRVYLFFDKDSSGVTNILSCVERLHKQKLYVCRFPKHRNDPAEMTREEVQRSIERALPIHEFMRRARNVNLTKEVLAYG